MAFNCSNSNAACHKLQLATLTDILQH